MGKILIKVSIEHLQILVNVFMGVHKHNLHGNVAHWRRWLLQSKELALMIATSNSN